MKDVSDALVVQLRIGGAAPHSNGRSCGRPLCKAAWRAAPPQLSCQRHLCPTHDRCRGGRWGSPPPSTGGCHHWRAGQGGRSSNSPLGAPPRHAHLSMRSAGWRWRWVCQGPLLPCKGVRWVCQGPLLHCIGCPGPRTPERGACTFYDFDLVFARVPPIRSACFMTVLAFTCRAAAGEPCTTSTFSLSSTQASKKRAGEQRNYK